MIYVLIIVLILMYWIYKYIRFIRNVTVLSLKSNLILVPDHTKCLDIRDSSDFEKEHIPNSINISIGRLPYVWRKENLTPEDSVIILTNNYFKGIKAIRILRKQEFYDLYLLVGTITQFIEWSQSQQRNSEQFCNEYDWSSTHICSE
ncbi:rhodanese-like domain-containing protein [Paenibacillus sp. MYb63]|uniref:Rhodanese domain-containing protein n=2 Tax=Paenibacillus TaxID=44249 RepID=A0A1R1BEH8_PAEAM|nr:hypothetical protein BK131_29745 [Paenibacillus amylolyticus]PRA07824.1 rhodanese-like domain-containing protein [Paenibacillus sp. MYb63]PRA51468.1 rhodanese-like domain-containing protein [Paenibacillus sp. MYb67]